jgi:hypothetical protein
MPYVIVARWRPRDGERDRIEAILRELVSEVRKEPGNLAFVAQRSNDDPYEFLLYEQYERERRSAIITDAALQGPGAGARGSAAGPPGTAGVYDRGVKWPVRRRQAACDGCGWLAFCRAGSEDRSIATGWSGFDRASPEGRARAWRLR